jgi:hypothetical protein
LILEKLKVLINLDQRSAQAAAGSSETLKTLTHSRLVVALSTSSALETVVVGEDVLSDVTCGMKKINSIQKRSAPSCASVVFHDKKVLLSLVAVSSEGNVDANHIVGKVKVITVHMDTVNNTIGEVEQGRLNVRRHSRRGGSVDLDGDGGESLVKARFEGEGKSSLGKSTGTVSGESDSLSLILSIIQLVQTTVHHVIPMGTHALGTVNISVLRIADTATDLVVVKSVVCEGLLRLGELHVLMRKLSSTKGELIDVLTGSMTRAIIGARSALASLTFVTIKALALTGLTVAKSLASTFSVSVTSIIVGLGSAYIGAVNPGELEGADSVGTITGIMGHTQAPVIVTDAKSTVAFSMTTARVVTSGRCTSNQGKG